MLEQILKAVCNWCRDHGRILVIAGTSGIEDAYLIRYYVFRSQWFNIFIHIFLRSDRDDWHDHPWDFATYLVRGQYIEERPAKTPGIFQNDVEPTFRHNTQSDLGIFKLNRLVFRKAEALHRVILYRSYTAAQIDQAPMTICVTGPVRREWGFVRLRPPVLIGEVKGGRIYRATPAGSTEWVGWREYLGLPPDAGSRG